MALTFDCVFLAGGRWPELLKKPVLTQICFAQFLF